MDMSWKNGALTEASITAGKGDVEIRGGLRSVTCNNKPVETKKTEHGFSFSAEEGNIYRVV